MNEKEYRRAPTEETRDLFPMIPASRSCKEIGARVLLFADAAGEESSHVLLPQPPTSPCEARGRPRETSFHTT
jgi:hypothetical protein